MAKNKAIFKKLDKYQKIYDDLSLRIDKLYEFEEDFKNFSEDLKELEDYYHEEWLEDLDEVKDEQQTADYEITSEDAIWNLLSDHYEYNKKLLKVLADELNK